MMKYIFTFGLFKEDSALISPYLAYKSSKFGAKSR
jgi:hypothetical protein